MAKKKAVEPTLFGEVEPAEPINPAPVKRCIDAYFNAFMTRFGFKPRITGGKHGKLMKELIATWGEDDVLSLIVEFFTTTDPRILRSSYTVEAFYALAQHLKLRQHGHYVDARTAERIDAAARALKSMKAARVSKPA